MVDALGISSAVIFFLSIFGYGLFISFKRRMGGESKCENTMVGKRDIGMIIGTFTMTATWVGGGYLSGTAEQIFSSNGGLVWIQAPIGYASSLLIAGLFFAKKFREKRFLTIMDPFKILYGSVISALLTLPALLGELLWSSAVLLVLASSLKIITGMNQSVSVAIAALSTVVYTIFGGIYAVAYTDAMQLIIMTIGLIIVAPFALKNPYKLPPLQLSQIDYIGVVTKKETVMYVDLYITYIFGGLPWQALFQRVLSSKSPKIASYVSSISAVMCILLSIPVVFVGIAAKQTDWESINLTFNASRNDSRFKFMYESDVLPLTIAYLTPPAVKFIGIGALISATVSSISSSVLAAASLLTQNIYSDLFRPKTSSREYFIAQIVSTVLIGIIISAVSILSTSVYTLFGLCSDFIYILLFPQLVLMVYTDFSNSYGVLCGYFTTLVFRLACDTDIKNIFTTHHKYPGFPYKTVSMLIGIVVTASVSYLARYLIQNVNPEWDFLKFYRSGKPQCFKQIELNKSESENKL